MEAKYLEKLNIRLSNLNRNNIDSFDKQNYIKLFSDCIYSECYENDIRINYESLQHLLCTLLDGTRIENKVYGGIKKILFSESINLFENLIQTKLICHLDELSFEDIYIYVPSQCKNSEMNAIIFGYSLYRLLRNTERFGLPKYISNLYLLNEISFKKDILLFILDDYSYSGSNLLERIKKIKNVISDETQVFFMYSYVCSDTIHNLVVNYDSVPENYYIYFHSIIFNYPIFKFNYLSRNNSRFFCLCGYYSSIFNFLDNSTLPNSTFRNIRWMGNETTREWYDYCLEISSLMDRMNVSVQKILANYYSKYNTILLPITSFDFYLPTCHIITEYNEISDNEKNIFLIGKIQENLYFKFIK